MNIWNGLDSYPQPPAAVVATIGNYDGVHLGHQQILRRVVEDAAARGLRSMMITFWPHPVSVVAPDHELRLLQTRRQKLDMLAQAGLTDLLILPFTPELAAIEGQRFFDQYLADRVRLAAVHVGENFRFGQAREGDLELLAAVGKRRGFEVHGVPAVELDGRTISSSAIRRALDEGRVGEAARMLGRPYRIAGEVVAGDGRGRKLDCPTANIETENDVILKPGVYVTETRVIAGRFPSVSNVGVRPTFDGGGLTVETHLLEFDEDLYHEQIEVDFLERLRDEQKFDGPEQLADQIARDRAAAAAFFQNQPLGTP
jgi:riboflavin kinase/FMN adenylyltransferase